MYPGCRPHQRSMALLASLGPSITGSHGQYGRYTRSVRSIRVPGSSLSPTRSFVTIGLFGRSRRLQASRPAAGLRNPVTARSVLWQRRGAGWVLTLADSSALLKYAQDAGTTPSGWPYGREYYADGVAVRT